jgi:hypothetical protein
MNRGICPDNGGRADPASSEQSIHAPSCGFARLRDATIPIRVWVRKFEEGALDEDAQAADLIQEYEARIAALERLVGKQALELEFLKGALRSTPLPRSGTTSAITGPVVSPSRKDAG